MVRAIRSQVAVAMVLWLATGACGTQGTRDPSPILSVGQVCNDSAQCSNRSGVDGVHAVICSGQGVCSPTCDRDSDCGSPHICLDGCFLGSSCDPVANTGCPAGQACELVAGASPGRVATGCTTSAAGADSIGVIGRYPGDHAEGPIVEDEVVCRLDRPSCPSGRRCMPLDGPPLGPVDGVSYGTCRIACDLATNECPSGTVCMLETNAGRPPITSCLPYDDNYCSDGMGGMYLCGVNLPVAAACITAYAASFGFAQCDASCASDSDCPSGASCESGECVAVAPCDPISPTGPACGAGQTCVIERDGSGGGTFACTASGGATSPSRCGSDSDCAFGSACRHYGDPSDGICEYVCNVGDGVCSCVSENPPVSVVVQSPLSAHRAVYDVGTCTTPCDPVAPDTPAGGCLSTVATLTCVPFVDSSGTQQTDCVAPTGMGMGANACASSPLACAPGYTCRASDQACVKWCYVGDPASCPTGQSCVAASPAVAIAGVTYGTCQ